ncbi:hypothetical protein BGW37DRAFT_478750 [Umbelopsis sp. PMI_123]|nr:hypothetical protein BGW37DRAFT_478750 [Umbelopsis sp. PMI_123]
MSRSADHSHLAREVEPPTTPASQIKTIDAIPPSSSRSFLSSVVDLFQQAKTNATNEFDQLYDTFSVSRENVTPRKNASSNRQRVMKRYSHTTPSAMREKRYVTSLTPHFEQQNINDSPIRKPARQAISSTRSIRHWDRSKNENDFQPNRSLTKALERAATVEPSVLHNATSYISTISNSWTRLDLDELDDELHRVARLDRNLDIVRQQVQALFSPSTMEYNEHESSFVSKKSNYFGGDNVQGDEPSTQETIFSEQYPQMKLIRSSSVADSENNIFNRSSQRYSKDNEPSLVSRTSKLPALQISPVRMAKPPPTQKTPSKPSPFRRPFRTSSPSPHKTQHHPQRMFSKSPKHPSSLAPDLLQELTSIKLRPTNTIMSPNGTVRANKHWDEIQQSKRNSIGGRNIYDQAGTGKSSPLRGFGGIADSQRMETDNSTLLGNSQPTAHNRIHITNLGHTQLNSASPRTLYDELSNAGANFNHTKKAASQRTTVLKRLEDSEIFSEENDDYFNSPRNKDRDMANIISGDEYTFHGQRFRVEQEIS